MKYITSGYFEPSIQEDEIAEFNKTWADPKWDFAKSFATHANKVSRSAIKIAARIKTEFGYDLFPLIVTVGRKGYRSSGGSFFKMFGQKEEIKGGELYFSEAARLYLLKKSKLYQWSDFSSAWAIGIE